MKGGCYALFCIGFSNTRNALKNKWFNEFTDFLKNKIKIALISWEEIISFIKIFVHFSWAGDSARIRDYKSETQVLVQACTTAEIKENIKSENEVRLSPGDRKPVSDIKWWYDYIQKLNKEKK